MLDKVKISLWKKKLPFFISHGAASGDPYHYYTLYFVDTARDRYVLVDYANEQVILHKWVPELQRWAESVSVTVEELNEMEPEIIHYRRAGELRFGSIILFYFSYYTRFSYIKNGISRAKGRLASSLFARKEVKSRDRIALLNLLVNEHIRQRPSQVSTGVRTADIIELLYGKLWYKHIRNEEFSRKVTLILQSLVITDDLRLIDDRYCVQGKSIATIVEHEKEEKRYAQQSKMQKNMVRLMLIITFSTLMITLAILAQAGIVDLHKLWQAILSIKPLRFLLKLI